MGEPIPTAPTRTPYTREHCIRCNVEFIELPERLGGYGPRSCPYPKHCPHNLSEEDTAAE